MIQRREISADEVEIVPSAQLSREDMEVLQKRLDEVLDGPQRIIALNFESLSSLSSSAIGKILHFKQLCDANKRTLVIRKCNPQMLQLLRMIKFDTLIKIEE